MVIGNKLELICLLFPIANKWREIGESLSIIEGDLENIETEKCSNTDRLAGVIQMWFVKKTRPVKWSTIITAVELPPVNEPSLAECILQKCLLVKLN